MKLTKQHTALSQKKLATHVIRKDKFPYNSVANVYGYINYLNRNIEPDTDMIDGKKLDTMMMPSGLADFLEPRRVRFDINNRCQANLLDKSVWDSNQDSLVRKEKVRKSDSQLVSEYKALKAQKPDAVFEDIPEYEIREVRDLSKIEETCPPGYKYSDFLDDLQEIWTAIRVNGELNKSVQSSVADVNLLSIIDKISLNGFVKWDGTINGAFIPYYLVDMGLGFDDLDYSHADIVMIEEYLTTSVVSIFTK
jgi:hypothetical protein